MSGARTRIINIVIHVTWWASLLVVPFIAQPLSEQTRSSVSGPDMRLDVVFVLLMMVVFYVNFLVLAPRYLMRKRYAAYALASLLLLALVMTVAYVIGHELIPVDWSDPRTVLVEWGALIFPFMLIGMASTGIRFVSDRQRLVRQQEILELERSRHELDALRARVDPHYLFNSLNTIFALAHRKDPRTEDAVMKLSHLMRYVLSAGGKGSVTLASEWQHLQAYVDFQRLRSTEHVQVAIELRGDASQVSIEPLLFQPLVENAFKHGVSAHEASPIRIELDVRPEQLHFHVSNRVHRQTTGEGPTGAGMSDLRRRLELTYPGKHELRVRVEEGIYRMDLSIDRA
jgi:two-component system, LytTR family, sensor kinase